VRVRVCVCGGGWVGEWVESRGAWAFQRVSCTEEPGKALIRGEEAPIPPTPETYMIGGRGEVHRGGRRGGGPRQVSSTGCGQAAGVLYLLSPFSRGGLLGWGEGVLQWSVRAGVAAIYTRGRVGWAVGCDEGRRGRKRRCGLS
jgi:hypothetical protein